MGGRKGRKPSPRILEKRAEKKELFVAAARRVIAEHGISEASVHGLSRTLGLSPGALYWYFPSREALIGEVQRRVFQELSDDLARDIARFGREAQEKTRDRRVAALTVLLELARLYLRLPELRPEHARMIAFSLDPRVWLDDGEGALLAPVLAGLFREVALPFHEAAHVGALLEGVAQFRAVQYWAALQGLVQTGKLARLSPGLFDVPRLGLASAEALLSAWGAKPKALARAKELLATT